MRRKHSYERVERIYNLYDYQDGRLCFITTADRSYARELNDDVYRLLLRVWIDNGSLLERELIALNRWLMGKDPQIDFEHSRSKVHRSINFTSALKQLLTGEPS